MDHYATIISDMHTRSFLEAVLWISGLGLMAWSNPFMPSLVNICVFDALGVPFCPGEGLGHAIGFLARGEWALAWDAHKAAPLVVVVLVHRSTMLLYSSIRRIRTNDVQGYSIPA